MTMTVCIAALADNGKKIVLATDRMITASIPIQCEYENDDVEKMRLLTDNAVAQRRQRERGDAPGVRPATAPVPSSPPLSISKS